MFRITFMVKDKHLAPVQRILDGLVYEFQSAPVKGAEVSPAGHVRAVVPGGANAAVAAMIRKSGKRLISAADIKAMSVKAGLAAKSYSNVLAVLVGNGMLKSNGEKGVYRVNKIRRRK